ncbi:hypothetical protein [Arsenophonus nasoniae]|uniref:hypothetical protein n=1 Tax=Arsenophonus nasoniae TaxID=638 RepID=UPI003CC82B8C
MSYTLPNGKTITSEVLLKLKQDALPHLPMACKVCPAAMWQLTGTVSQPSIRCFCRVMHTFTWDSQHQNEVLDCDLIYQEQEAEENIPMQTGLPAFLASPISPSPSNGPDIESGQEWEEPPAR